MLPPRIPKKQKRSGRWRSQAHCAHVASYACCRCGSMERVEAAHVRIGSHAGMGQKPDDWRTVSLCHECHNGTGPYAQHTMGERSFWAGKDVEALIAEFIRTSPRRHQIADAQRERLAAHA